MKKIKKILTWMLFVTVISCAIYVILIDPLMMFYKYDGWLGVLKWLGMLTTFFVGLLLFIRLVLWLNDEN